MTGLGISFAVVAAVVLNQGRQQPDIPPRVLAVLHCVALSVPAVARAVSDGYRPLLIVNGQEVGRMSKPKRPCPSGGEPHAMIKSLSFVKPGHAEKVFGKKGRDGVVQVSAALLSSR